MRKIITTITVLLGLGGAVSAQQPHYTTSGIIEFERRTNVYGMIQREINKDNEVYFTPALEAYKKNSPQFRVLNSTLTFSDNKTLFTPKDADPPTNNFMAESPLMSQNNIIYTDLALGTVTARKKVFESPFLVKDSTRKIKWKITDETREIAGYTCRRANGIMLDSVYVVAFYTGKIPLSGGPESFNGLPGMILGVALPHENVTWFATKITDSTLPPDAVAPPQKGKPTDNKGFRTMLDTALKDYGQIAKDFIRQFLF